MLRDAWSSRMHQRASPSRARPRDRERRARGGVPGRRDFLQRFYYRDLAFIDLNCLPKNAVRRWDRQCVRTRTYVVKVVEPVGLDRSGIVVIANT